MMVGPNSMHLIHIHVLNTDAIVFHFLPLIFNRTKVIIVVTISFSGCCIHIQIHYTPFSDYGKKIEL